MTLLVLLAFAVANVSRAQLSTASLVDVGFLIEPPDQQGQVVGTGADGTTFIVSGTFGEIEVGYTMTVVQDVSHISKGAELVTSSITMPYEVQCELQTDGDAVCTERLDLGVITTTQDIILTGIVVSPGGGGSGGVTASSATTPIQTKTHHSVTATAAGPDPTDTFGGDSPSGGSIPSLGGLPGFPDAGSLSCNVPGRLLAIPFVLVLMSII
ncbi:uncharacterized protein FOMMEDRAFT_151676 [Fomitiporia mediterranea MF3/22]|uniref:uncharacterized protein n=1 Tax=Fomitiporia mediterranea (strain MF3/22) TaxID=694068 RepID=UPI0004408E47|nr:uncharacterized protein FOMMEDRAFT_151676 [Fomitiporia mediterranea MF3/22]EJD06415.1 hypothetical protein FOMMEDRAFT_151676 [Fomitiporia mediterranea MF3/22]